MRLAIAVEILRLSGCMCCYFPSAQASWADKKHEHGLGKSWSTGDSFLQRQNEPSITVSTRDQVLKGEL